MKPKATFNAICYGGCAVALLITFVAPPAIGVAACASSVALTTGLTVGWILGARR